MGHPRDETGMTKPTGNDGGQRDTPPRKPNPSRLPPDQPYLLAEHLDYLARMNMELLAELWITRDRLAVFEELVTAKGVLESGEIDDFVPPEDFAGKLEQLRDEMVSNILGAPFQNEHTVESLVAKGRRRSDT